VTTTPIPPGGVVITSREVYDEVQAVHKELRALSGKLDALPVLDHDAQLVDHEGRLRALERARWPLPSVAALTSVAALVAALWPSTAR
jgi:hypothetical protein